MLIGVLSEGTGMFAGDMLLETFFTLSTFYMANAGRRFVSALVNPLALDSGNSNFYVLQARKPRKCLYVSLTALPCMGAKSQAMTFFALSILP